MGHQGFSTLLCYIIPLQDADRDAVRSLRLRAALDLILASLAELPRLAWDNAALSLLERTLDDSANRRILPPEAFLAADEILRAALDILTGLRVDEEAMSRNLARYGPFAAAGRLLMRLVKAGADRQRMHEIIRQKSMAAWDAVRRGGENPLVESLAGDLELQKFLSEGEIGSLQLSAEGEI